MFALKVIVIIVILAQKLAQTGQCIVKLNMKG